MVDCFFVFGWNKRTRGMNGRSVFCWLVEHDSVDISGASEKRAAGGLQSMCSQSGSCGGGFGRWECQECDGEALGGVARES